MKLNHGNFHVMTLSHHVGRYRKQSEEAENVEVVVMTGWIGMFVLMNICLDGRYYSLIRWNS